MTSYKAEDNRKDKKERSALILPPNWRPHPPKKEEDDCPDLETQYYRAKITQNNPDESDPTTDYKHRIYTLERELGSGAIGSVWFARSRIDNKDDYLPEPVAIKLFLKSRFAIGYSKMIGIAHTHMAKVFGTGETNDSYGIVSYAVMEHIAGENLENSVKKNGAVSLEHAIDIAEGILDVIDYLGRKDLVHRDIKPANIVLRTDGSPVLVDYDLTKEKSKIKNKKSDSLVGTPQFLAPELWDESVEDDLTEVYSLGTTLAYILSGNSPFPGTDINTLYFFKQLGIFFGSMEKIDTRAVDLIDGMTHPDRKKRFTLDQTLEELARLKENLREPQRISGGIYTSANPNLAGKLVEEAKQS